jgi:hypothetical protein
MQVVLERMSAERLPELKLTTAAFGISDMGQLNQLPIYDLFAHRQHPKVVVLVFVIGDFSDNSALIQAINRGLDPAHMPKLFARRNAAGDMELQPIDRHWSNFRQPRSEQTPGRLRACSCSRASSTDGSRRRRLGAFNRTRSSITRVLLRSVPNIPA